MLGSPSVDVNNTSSVGRFTFESDMGGESNLFNFINTTDLLTAVQSFNSNNANQNYFTITY